MTQTTKSRQLASEIWHAMQAAPKYIDGHAIGNCEALKAAAELIEAAMLQSFEAGREFENDNR